MSTNIFTTDRSRTTSGHAWLHATSVAVLACLTLAACGTASSPAPAPSPSPSPVSSPTSEPAPPPVATPPQAQPIEYTTTPAPFGLTQSRTFDVWGWDSWPRSPTPSTTQLHWSADINKYEVLARDTPRWTRLEARKDVRFGGPPYQYDLVGNDDALLALYMLLWAPQTPNQYVGNAQIREGSSARDYFAFGIATEPGDVPITGTMTCGFAEDEIGEGEVTFDLAAGTLTGWAEPFWAHVRHSLQQTSFTRGATSFATTFGDFGVLEGGFFGPRATNIAVRSKGGGSGFSAVTGIMTGRCSQ